MNIKRCTLYIIFLKYKLVDLDIKLFYFSIFSKQLVAQEINAFSLKFHEFVLLLGLNLNLKLKTNLESCA